MICSVMVAVVPSPPRSRVSPTPALQRHHHRPLDPPSPASRWPTCSSIIAALRTTAIGLASPLPAMSGALPWTASNTAYALPRFAPGTSPSPPTSPAHRSRDHVAEQVLHHQHVELGRVERQLQADVVDRLLLELR